MNSVQIHVGDCLDALREMPDGSIDSIVTDPPYGLSFMGKRWDYDVPSVEIWAECLRVLKPGGYLLAFAGTRTQHRMAARIEDAGFEIRDMIAWVYGSGFPKSLDVSKAIDKAAGIEREDKFEGAFSRRAGPTGNKKCDVCGKWLVSGSPCKCPRPQDEPITEAARQWQGWGTALKPALEPITVARKPLAGTVAANVLAHGTGALNIDGCRVGWPDGKVPEIGTPGWGGPAKKLTAVPGQEGETVERSQPNSAGRWPANLIHDGSDEVLAAFPQAPGQLAKAAEGGDRRKSQNTYGAMARGSRGASPRADAGSAARFFYCAKASKKDRGEGNAHPTVKPTELMRYLLRLVTPPGGVVLDPFMGSGSTGKAAMLEGFRFIGCELSPEYAEIAKRRIAATQAQPGRPKQETTDLFAA